jgi:thioredoxin 1
VDNNQQIAMQYGIRSIPTLLVFKAGKVVEQIVGSAPKKALVEKLSKHLN